MPPFRSRTYTSFDGLRLHYRDYPAAGGSGARATVLCLPGLTRNARDFEDLAEHLSRRGHRVLCADLRGRGGSAYASDPMTYVPAIYVRDVETLLDVNGLAEVAIVGTSLGGILAMIMSAVMPYRLLGAVLNDIGPDLDPAGMARIAQFVGKAVPVASWDEAAAAIKKGEAAFYPDFGPDDWMREARHRFVLMPDGRLRADYDLDIAKPFAVAFAPVSLWPFFGSFREIPVLAVRGGLSDLLSADGFARMKQVKPDLEQVTVPNRGHVPLFSEPEIAPVLDRFLEGLPTHLGAMARLKRRWRAAAFLWAARRAMKRARQ
ncbi:MAG: alpha/beta hydrolase [Rhodospirillaceae bacterium]|nr:alpha/beta hydrolase [Rhodospirillaceae bacterium]